jgi:hypothetical protein
MLYLEHLPMTGIRTQNVSGDSYLNIGSCKSNYHIVVIGTDWFSLGIPFFSTNETDHDITEILLKVVLNTMILTLTLQDLIKYSYSCFP